MTRKWWKARDDVREDLLAENSKLRERLEELSLSLSKAEGECERLQAQLDEVLKKMRGEGVYFDGYDTKRIKDD